MKLPIIKSGALQSSMSLVVYGKPLLQKVMIRKSLNITTIIYLPELLMPIIKAVCKRSMA